ncbi:helix-turn-helix domain-containing protein [Lactobacillus sp. 23-2]|uniref:CdaR family transcriptional regulator n=1 Tax=Lactobacillus sp. 23-2 TaxID=2981842 RepID=UPI003837466F
MKLDQELAQKIVTRMMQEIPYNINVMDENGVIIASGEADRIGQRHVGAGRILKSQQIEVMSQALGEAGQPGVNMPIIVNQHLVGVVGITGDPTAVKPLARLLKTSTELLLEQQELARVRKEYDRRLERFLFQWSEARGELETNYDLMNAAERLGIDLMKPRRAVVLICAKTDLPHFSLDPDDYFLNYAHAQQLFFVRDEQAIQKLRGWAKKHAIPLGIGSASRKLGQSIAEAKQVINFHKFIPELAIDVYDELQFDLNLLSNPLSQEQAVIDRLKGQQDELTATLLTYIKNNCHVSQAADELHIHRNTLKYRLNRFKELTGLDPLNTRQLFKIYAILLKLRQEERE